VRPQEVRWAAQYGKPVVALVRAEDKGKIGSFIAEAAEHELDFSAIDFCTYDRSGPFQVKASLDDILHHVKEWEHNPKQVIKPAAGGGGGGESVKGLSDLLSSINLGNQIEAARSWCIEMGADDVADLNEEDYPEKLAAALELPPIRAKKLVKALRGV